MPQVNPGPSSNAATNWSNTRVVQVTDAQIAAPSPDILANTNAVYQATNGVLYQSTGTALARMPSGSQSALLSVPAKVASGKTRPIFVGVGNSLMAQSASGYAIAFETEYFSQIEWAMAFAGWPLQSANTGARVTLASGAVVSNGIYGFSGAESTPIAADMPQFFSRAGAIDVLFVQTMENDVTGSRTVPVITAAYDSIIAAALAAGAKLIYWAQCLPSTSYNTGAMLTKYYALDDYIKTKAAALPQMRIVKTLDLWADTSSSTALIPLTTGLFANYTDGTIHSRKGGMWLGKRIAEMMALDGLGYAARLNLPSPGETGWIFGLSTVVGTGGTFAGGYTGTPATPPVGLTVSNSLVGPTATANAAVYKGRPSLQLDVSAAAQASLLPAISIFSGNIATGWSVGDLVQFFVEYVIDSGTAPTGIRTITGQITFTGSTGPAITMFGRHSSGDAFNEDLVTDTPLLRATPVTPIPASTTGLRMFFIANSDDANAVAMRMQLLRIGMINWSLAG